MKVSDLINNAIEHNNRNVEPVIENTTLSNEPKEKTTTKTISLMSLLNQAQADKKSNDAELVDSNKESDEK